MKRENKIKFTVNDLDRNDLSFSLYAVPSVCCVVATLDDRKKSEIGVSAD